MTTEQIRTTSVRLPDIVWVVRSADVQWGYLGNIKVFSILRCSYYYRLDTRLPMTNGHWYPTTESRHIESIKAKAEEIYSNWKAELETPYAGELKLADDSSPR